MWHLFKHKSKHDIAFISSNGKYIVGSKQGYSKKSACISALLLLKVVVFQDDTKEPTIFELGTRGDAVPTDWAPEKKWK